MNRTLFTHDTAAMDVATAGELAATAIGLYLFLVAVGRLLKRRFGARLGVVYQLFCVAFAIYAGEGLITPGFLGMRDFGAASTLLGAGVLVRLLDQYFWHWYFEGKRQTSIPKFVREIAAAVVMLVAALCVLEFGYKVRVPGLLAGSGIIAVVLGFAMQNALGNVIACFTLQFGRSFKPGDWLLLDGQHVKAVEINWNCSRFVTNDDVQLDVPNQLIVKQTIVNYHGGGALHAMRLEIGLDYNAAPNLVKSILCQAAATAGGVAAEPAPNVFLKKFGDSSVNYELRYWLEDHRLYNLTSDAVQTNVWYALRRNNIQIPFPIRTVKLERRPAADYETQTAENGAALSLLRSRPLFQGMSEAHLSLLISQSPLRKFGVGESIIREGTDGSSMFALIEGKANVNVTTAGQPTMVATLGRGDCFGEMSLLTGETRSASVIASSDCDVLEIAKPTFAKVVEQDPTLLPRLSELLATRQMETEGVLQSRANQPDALSATQEEYRAGILKKLRSFFEL